MNARMETIQTILMAPMPQARMAVTSLSAARRERPSRIPARTAVGRVTVRVLGRV
jgi:hypothetical protein